MGAEEPATAANSRFQLLMEMVREAERVIDHQVESIEQIDSKLQGLVSLAQAALGGALALVFLVSTNGDERPDWFFPLAVGVGAVLNLRAVHGLLNAHSHLQRDERIGLGPSISWLRDKARDADWVAESHLISILMGLADLEDGNMKVMERKAEERRAALRALTWGVFLYAAGLIYLFARPWLYIAWRTIV